MQFVPCLAPNVVVLVTAKSCVSKAFLLRRWSWLCGPFVAGVSGLRLVCSSHPLSCRVPLLQMRSDVALLLPH